MIVQCFGKYQHTMTTNLLTTRLVILVLGSILPAYHALNGESSKLSLDTIAGWKAFEIITQGDKNEDGYTVPGEIDGIGAYLLKEEDTFRILMNHETGRACDMDTEATVTEVDIHLSRFKNAVSNMLRDGTLGNERNFVRRFRRAYDTIVDENGQEVASLPRRLRLFCSSQAYGPDTFGVPGEGFQDQIYIVGEEIKGEPYGRLFAINSSSRKLYQISGRTGDASGSQGGNGGMMLDSFENVALVRTFEKDHVAFLIGIDGGSEKLKLYVGQKNKDKTGERNTSDFLARNGLLYGSWFYLGGDLPSAKGQSNIGFFQSRSDNVLTSGHFEDVDTNPLDPTQVVLGDEENGIFVLSLTLKFFNGKFLSGILGTSFYSIEMIVKDGNAPFNNADNVAWTASGLIYVATDGSKGAIWEIEEDGSNAVKIATSESGFNPSGVVDISHFLGYEPASLLLASTMNCGSSMSLLIGSNATIAATPVPLPSPSTDAPTPSPADTPDNSSSVAVSSRQQNSEQTRDIVLSCISSFALVLLFGICILKRTVWVNQTHGPDGSESTKATESGNILNVQMKLVRSESTSSAQSGSQLDVQVNSESTKSTGSENELDTQANPGGSESTKSVESGNELDNVQVKLPDKNDAVAVKYSICSGTFSSSV